MKNKIKYGFKFIHSPEAVYKVEKLVQKEKPGIAHLHNIYHQLTPSIIPLLKKYDVKVVLTLHDGKLICPSYLMLNRGRICTDCADGSFWRPFLKNCQASLPYGLLFSIEAYWHRWVKSYEKADLFITPSHFLKKLVSKRIDPGRIRVLRNGIETSTYSPEWADQGYILYFGRLSREKGVETLLKAHRRLTGRMPLMVVGTGPLEEKLRDKYGNDKFIGHKDGEGLKEIIGNAAFVVVPSEWYENCSMVVLEAMAMGKAVIGSRIGGIPEQIDDGTTGLLFKMGDVDDLREKMALLSQDQNMREKMGRRARQKVEHEYSFDTHCKQLLDIYSSLLK